MNHKFLIVGIVLSIILLFLINLSVGSVAIPIKEIFSILIGEDSSKQTWEYIVLNYRLPKAIVAMLVGVGLSLRLASLSVI